MKKLIISLFVFVLVSCSPAPIQYVVVDAPYATEPWYVSCTWDYPCFYPHNTVFIYGWGYYSTNQYVYFHRYPRYRVKDKNQHYERGWRGVPQHHPEKHGALVPKHR